MPPGVVKGQYFLLERLWTGCKPILWLNAGVGKTTVIREMARVLADDYFKRVVIIDTSNEIGGDGDVPHPAVGGARRMQVPDPALQHRVMVSTMTLYQIRYRNPQILSKWIWLASLKCSDRWCILILVTAYCVGKVPCCQWPCSLNMIYSLTWPICWCEFSCTSGWLWGKYTLVFGVSRKAGGKSSWIKDGVRGWFVLHAEI